METKKIREALTEQRAIYKASVENSERMKQKVRGIIDSLDRECVYSLDQKGINVSMIYSLDLERMKTDDMYREESMRQLAEVIEKLHEYLEDGLGVSN